MNNPFQMIQMYQQFSSNFKGNAKEEVENLMRTGKMSQQQFNQLQQQATQFQSMLNNFSPKQ